MGGRVFLALVATALGAWLCATAGVTRAEAAVYWGSPPEDLGAANLDGGNPQWEYFYPAGGGGGLAVNSEYIYWAGPEGIGSASVVGPMMSSRRPSANKRTFARSTRRCTSPLWRWSRCTGLSATPT